MAKKRAEKFVSNDLAVLIKEAEEAIKEAKEADDRLIKLFL